MKRLIFLLAISFSQLSIGGICSPEDLSKEFQVIHINGILTDREKAEDNIEELSKRNYGDLNGKIEFNYAYNSNENAVNQIAEVMIQNALENISYYYYWLDDLSTAPQWFQDAVRNLAVEISEAQAVHDEDLQKLVDMIHTNRNYHNHKQILVPHSQGNFYANSAWRIAGDTSVGIVGVAPPTSVIEGDYPHVTMSNDLLIQAVEYVYPHTLDPTGTFFQFDDLFGHGFIKTYLRSGDVTKQIINVANSLEMPSGTSDPLTLRLTMKSATDNEEVDLWFEDDEHHHSAHLYLTVIEPDGTVVSHYDLPSGSGYWQEGYPDRHWYYLKCENIQAGLYTVQIRESGNSPTEIPNRLLLSTWIPQKENKLEFYFPNNTNESNEVKTLIKINVTIDPKDNGYLFEIL